MTGVPHDAFAARGRTALPALGAPTHALRHWLLGIFAALALTLCGTLLLLWGLDGPAYMLDLIAAFCG